MPVLQEQKNNHETALGALLDINELPATADYPEGIILPNCLHEKIIEAVEQSEDGRERSFNANYEDGIWCCDEIVAGMYRQVDKAHHKATTKRRPHIAVHTHTPLMPETEFSDDFLHEYYQELEEALPLCEVMRVLPSPGDIISIGFKQNRGTVVDILASDSTNFMFLSNCVPSSRNPVKWLRVHNDQTRRFGHYSSERKKMVQNFHRGELDAQQAFEFLLKLTARVMQRECTSYISHKNTAYLHQVNAEDNE